jgi:hypothetical protein
VATGQGKVNVNVAGFGLRWLPFDLVFRLALSTKLASIAILSASNARRDNVRE